MIHEKVREMSEIEQFRSKYSCLFDPFAGISLKI